MRIFRSSSFCTLARLISVNALVPEKVITIMQKRYYSHCGAQTYVGGRKKDIKKIQKGKQNQGIELYCNTFKTKLFPFDCL